MSDEKLSNPKDAVGSTRIDMSLLSPAALMEEALAMTEGLLKYGRNNYRVVGVRASIYVAAALRHIWKYFMGEERDPKTGIHHLGSARACLGVILDAAMYGKLNDDRPPKCAGFSEKMDDLVKRVEHLQKMYEDRCPTHYYETDESKVNTWRTWNPKLNSTSPVLPDCTVTIQLRDETLSTGVAGGFNWAHNPDDPDDDIIAYKVE